MEGAAVVMLISGDPSNGARIASYLADHGFEVRTIERGVLRRNADLELRPWIERYNPDVVLWDFDVDDAAERGFFVLFKASELARSRHVVATSFRRAGGPSAAASSSSPFEEVGFSREVIDAICGGVPHRLPCLDTWTGRPPGS